MTTDEVIAMALRDTSSTCVEAIRLDERRNLVALIEPSAGLIADFAKDKEAAVKLVAYLISLGTENRTVHR